MRVLDDHSGLIAIYKCNNLDGYMAKAYVQKRAFASAVAIERPYFAQHASSSRIASDCSAAVPI